MRKKFGISNKSLRLRFDVGCKTKLDRCTWGNAALRTILRHIHGNVIVSILNIANDVLHASWNNKEGI